MVIEAVSCHCVFITKIQICLVLALWQSLKVADVYCPSLSHQGSSLIRIKTFMLGGLPSDQWCIVDSTQTFAQALPSLILAECCHLD